MRGGVVAIALGSPVWALPAVEGRANDLRKLAYGRHLAQECTSCHRIDGVDNGIPSITGWPTDNFLATMDFYRNGARDNQVMVSVVQSLDDAQVNALAAYYGSLPKPAK